jgi:hypothetical protein
MEPWRELAIKLFPDYRVLYEEESETIWSVLFDQLSEVIEAHLNGNINRLEKIYGFAEWCYAQRDIEPELWEAAVPAFYEHLVDHTETYHAIPQWIKPAIFQELLPVFEYRLVSLPKEYGIIQPGSYHELLVQYDQANGTNFAQEHDQPLGAA